MKTYKENLTDSCLRGNIQTSPTDSEWSLGVGGVGWQEMNWYFGGAVGCKPKKTLGGGGRGMDIFWSQTNAFPV